MEKPKNHAYRAGAFAGTLKGLKYNIDILKILECDTKKHDAFIKIIQDHIESTELRCKQYEEEN